MRKKAILIMLTSAAIIALGAAGARAGYMYSSIKQYSNVIFPQVFVEDINLSGRTKSEAIAILNESYSKVVAKKKFYIKASDNTYTIDFEKLNARYGVEDAVNEAFGYGRKSNIIKQYFLIQNPEVTKIKLDFTFDPKPVKEIVLQIQKDVDKEPANAELKAISSGSFQVTPEKIGAKLNAEKLENDILAEISNPLSGKDEVQAPVQVLQAAVTKEQLDKINTRISSFSTSFATSSENRIANISLATQSITGKLLMPGESFSFNDIVGKRTADRGYKEAPVIVNNKLDSGLGGGICQVSTTLYNAVIRANIDSTERIHHSLPSSYVGLGMDATVDYGRLDYKFKNTLQYPIYIEGVINGKKITFNVYSDKSLSYKTYDLLSETYDTMKAATKYIDEPTMYQGENEVVQKPSDGYKVKVYKRIYENGKFIGQELITNETYKKIDGLVKRGIKKKPISTANAGTTQNKAPVQNTNSPNPSAPVNTAENVNNVTNY